LDLRAVRWANSTGAPGGPAGCADVHSMRGIPITKLMITRTGPGCEDEESAVGP
jgi:hypothetical protein